MGILVVDENSEKISKGKAAGPFFGKIVSAIILYVGFMMAGWDPKKTSPAR